MIHRQARQLLPLLSSRLVGKTQTKCCATANSGANIAGPKRDWGHTDRDHRESTAGLCWKSPRKLLQLACQRGTEKILQCLKQMCRVPPNTLKIPGSYDREASTAKCKFYFHSEMFSRKQIETLSWPFLRFLYMLQILSSCEKRCWKGRKIASFVFFILSQGLYLPSFLNSIFMNMSLVRHLLTLS